MMGTLTIFSATAKGDAITLRDIANMIESLGGNVTFAESDTIDFDFDAPLKATVSVNGTMFTDARIHQLSFEVNGTNA